METIVRVDDKGRILIPVDFREKIKLGKVVRLRIENDRLVIEPLRNPLETLRSIVNIKINASQNPKLLSKIAERELNKLL